MSRCANRHFTTGVMDTANWVRRSGHNTALFYNVITRPLAPHPPQQYRLYSPEMFPSSDDVIKKHHLLLAVEKSVCHHKHFLRTTNYRLMFSLQTPRCTYLHVPLTCLVCKSDVLTTHCITQTAAVGGSTRDRAHTLTASGIVNVYRKILIYHMLENDNDNNNNSYN